MAQYSFASAGGTTQGSAGTGAATVLWQMTGTWAGTVTFEGMIKGAYDGTATATAGLAISTNFDVANATAIDYRIAGTRFSLAASTVCDTGTTAAIATTKWGIMLISATKTGTLVGTWATNAGVGYADEATAKLAIPALPDNQAQIGYITVKAAAATWTAGTDALTTGTGGTVANTTTYYNTTWLATTTWATIGVTKVLDGTTVSTTTANGIFMRDGRGFERCRARWSTATSGTLVIDEVPAGYIP